jgi:SAM-dependent methyltransferase
MTAADAPAPPDLTVIPCKCCGADARIYGAVEFNRTCEDHRGAVFPPTGVDIPYHRCVQCGFLFTIAFDHFTPDDFQRHIYNASYILADPDFVERRPAANATLIHQNFGHAASALRVLDYGGGNGVLAQRLRQLGFDHAETYDPFYEGSRRPTGTFDLVTAFEVLEHTPTPRDTLADMASFLSRDGMLFCSTLMQPDSIDRERLNWWYAAPRNGHVSLYSGPALAALATCVGLRWAAANQLLQVFFRGSVPAFAAGLVAGAGPGIPIRA